MRGSRQRKGLPINGMLLLNKPLGLSSNQALQNAKRLLGARKAGHTGSLDPLATGVLPLCFGETTKIASLFLNGDKTYRVAIKLGVSTDSGDGEGTITDQRRVDVSRQGIERVLDQFRGEFLQTPPMFSALKKDGQPLYKLARKGVEIERTPRLVNVSSLVLNDWYDDEIDLTVACSKGFYIRSLAMDIGQALGCGGHVAKLCRTVIGSFDLSQTHTLEQIEDAGGQIERESLLLPTDQVLTHFPSFTIPANLAVYLCQGQSIRPTRKPDVQVNETIRVYAENGVFLGLCEFSEQGKIIPKKMFASSAD